MVTLWTGSASRKKSVEKKVLNVLFEPIASLIAPHNTHPHARTPVPGTTAVSYNSADACLAAVTAAAAASRRKSAWRILAPLASSVYRTMAVARGIEAILPTTAMPVVALAVAALG